MDVEEDILKWAEVRVRRLDYLSKLMVFAGSIERKGKFMQEAYDFLSNHVAVLETFWKKIYMGSFCPTDCKSLCCYFSTEYSNQLPITRRELEKLKAILINEGKNPEEYYTLVPFKKITSGIREYIENTPGFFFNIGEEKTVCMINPSGRIIEKSLLWNKPRCVRRFKNMWVDENSVACRFLDGSNKCVLYNKLRFTTCRRFFCLSAISTVVLRQLGFADDSILKRSMAEINSISNSVAVAFRKNNLLAIEKDYDSKVRDVAAAYLKKEDVSKKLVALKEFEREYDKDMREILTEAMASY